MTITRDEIIMRSETIWLERTVFYTQFEIHLPDGYRKDCSGYANLCVGEPAPGRNTAAMVTSGLWYEIAASALRPGDFIGIMGAGTGGDAGHVMLFVRWVNDDPNDNHCVIREQSGGQWGWHERTIDYPLNTAYRSWRYKNVVDPTPDTMPPALHRKWPDYMPTSEWFGDINGPDASHGGFFARERPDIAAIQQRLYFLGYVEVGQADGIFGPLTIAAVSRWQQTNYAAQTEFFGQVWQDDWLRLFTY